MAHLLSRLDLWVIGLYFGGLLLAGVLSRTRLLKTREHFLGGQSASWPRIGFALYASTISATSLVAMTGAAYSHGISVFNYEWMAAVVLTIFCAFVLPTYIKSKVFTVPEFLELRYGRFVRTYVSGLAIVLGVFLDAAGALFAGAILFQMLFPDWPLWQVCALLALLAGGFLMAGGLRSVMMIEAIQGLILILACASLAYFTFQAAGGWHVALSRIDPTHLKLVLPATDKDMPWTGLVTGVPLIGFYFWCTNQIIVQRTLAARNLDHGRWGSLLGGAMKLTTLFLIILPGAAAISLFPHLDEPDKVFSHILFEILPHGLTGLIVAACLVSILSALSGIYNSVSTLLTMDFIRRFRPDLDDRALVRAGQIVTVGLMVISILWAPQIVHFQETLWKYLQSVLCYFVPPIAAVFLAGLFIGRANAAGAAAGLITGTTASIILFTDAALTHLIPLHFLVAAILIFLIAMAATLLTSLVTPRPDAARIKPLMFSLQVWQTETEHLRSVRWYQNYRWLSLALLLLTAGVVLAFI